MKEPDLDRDGWCLEDGEARHSGAPETFWIPDLSRRESLQPGDLVKLLFRISRDDEADPVAVERMWVLVRGRAGSHYFGVLCNDPDSIEENDELWSGVEIPFGARHVIDIIPADDSSREKAKEPPTRNWPRR